MGHTWVLDVLADLQTFADANELPGLAMHLKEAGLIAAAEIVTQSERVPQQSYGKAITFGNHPSDAGFVNRA